MKLIIDINDNEYMRIKEYPNNITSYPVTIHIYDAIRKGIPLEQETCEDEEYEKDLNRLKEQIFKEGNTLISKQDLLERFVEIDNEYKNSHWNLLQILTNIDILIGKEPCEDAVSRQAVLDLIANYDLSMGQVVKGIHALPPVNPQKIGHWIDMGSGQGCSECREIQYGYDSFRYFCANCGAKMEGGAE